MPSRDESIEAEKQQHRAFIAARSRLLQLSVPDDYTSAVEMLRGELPRKRTYWNRREGILAVGRYIGQRTPELFHARPFGFDAPLSILEFGPGVGVWMEYARAAGHDVEGVDATTYTSNVGIYQEITRSLDLSVRYVGAPAVYEEARQLHHLIHIRGALDAIVGRFDEDTQRERVRQFAEACVRYLVPGGVLHVVHNRDDLMEMIQEELEAFDGLRFQRIDDQTTRHWKL